MTVNAIILDLDGVLIDTETIARKAWFQAARDCDFEFSDQLYANMVGRPVALCRNIIQPNLPEHVDIDVYMQRSEYLYRADMDKNGIQLIQGVPELLDWIENSGLSAAIATSSTRDHAHQKIRIAGLGNRINTIVTCDDVQKSKPAPDIFLFAAQRLGYPAEQCIVIDDAESGITGANEAGTIPIMLPSTVAASENARRLSFAVSQTLFEALKVIQTLVKQTGNSRENQSLV